MGIYYVDLNDSSSCALNKPWTKLWPIVLKRRKSVRGRYFMNHIIICCFQFHSSDFDASALWKHSEKKSTNFRHSSAFNIPLFFISKATNKFQKVLCKFDNNPTFSCVKSNFLINFIRCFIFLSKIGRQFKKHR